MPPSANTLECRDCARSAGNVRFSGVAFYVMFRIDSGGWSVNCIAHFKGAPI